MLAARRRLASSIRGSHVAQTPKVTVRRGRAAALISSIRAFGM
jgi:hypothetical protein